MKQIRFFSVFLIVATVVSLMSCGPSIKTTASWINREKPPAQPIKSIFIIALTENMAAKIALETDLAAAAESLGIKAVRCIDAMGPVGIKDIAPHKEAFEKKLAELGSEAIFTIALVDKQSETRYVPGSTSMYSPYGYGGYGGYGAYGGFGGYYGYSATVMSSPGYYTTDKTYFIEAKVFDLKTGETLLSIQSKAENPAEIKKASKQYTQTLMAEMKSLGIKKR